ncbi:alpha/beta hydrolase [Hamadaea tsunoensis]|uniref:alpha/beta hydrolase n=1 Tax=Hamadaea tsunoensis TaxID=53368 RepID=UPI00042A10F9|nr:alpha/beta hydrolase [Hamadaea tsunoensis]
MRRTIATLVAVVLAAGAVGLPDTASAATGRISWQPCTDAPDVQCATLTVPVDWARPSGPTVSLALVRRQATDPAHRIGSLVINPGGPGGSGVRVVKRSAWLSPAVASRFDIIGFDPRGVGLSNPVLCDEAVEREAFPADPQSPAQFAALQEHNRRLDASCRALTGPAYDHMNTADVARDLDAIRDALGERKLNYYGVSYGTLIGQQYAELFPQRIRTLVLDSDMDHSISSTWRFMRTETVGLQESFDEFVAWSDRTADSPLHGTDVRALFADLYARAGRGELTLPGTTDTMSTLDLLGLVHGSMYDPDWRTLAADLAQLAAPEPAVGYGAAVPDPFQAIFCQDWRLPVSSYYEWAAYKAALAAITPDMKISPLGQLAVAGCTGLPGPVRNPQHALRVQGAPPILMVNSRFDPATPYQWAEDAARQSGAVLLTYDGWGHGAYFKGSDCVTGAVDDYLVTGVTPARGTHCAAVPPHDSLRASPQPSGSPTPGRLW